MAGYFRQLAERAIAPMPALHPLRVASAERPPPMGFDEALAPIRPAPGLSDTTTGLAGDMAPRSAPRDELANQAATIASAGQPPHPALESDVEHRTTMPHQSEEGPVAPTRNTPASLPDAALERAQPILGEDRRTRVEIAPAVPPLPSPMRMEAPIRPYPRPEAPKTMPTRSRRQQDTRGQRAEAETAPEVHIHIGRIELTAVAPSKPDRRESASTKKPMSLDEYLQHRRKAP